MGNAPTTLNPQHNNISAIYFCYHEGKRMNGSLKKNAATISHDWMFFKKAKTIGNRIPWRCILLENISDGTIPTTFVYCNMLVYIRHFHCIISEQINKERLTENSFIPFSLKDAKISGFQYALISGALVDRCYYQYFKKQHDNKYKLYQSAINVNLERESRGNSCLL